MRTRRTSIYRKSLPVLVGLLTAGLFGCGEKKEPDPAAELRAGPVSGFTTEAGGQASLQIVLGVSPKADVVLALQSDDESEGTISPSSLTFTGDNWNAPQTVTITGVDDAVADGNQSFKILILSITSDDARWAEVSLPSLSVTNIDDETAGVSVSNVSGAVTEWGDQASFTMVLNSQPTADVTVALVSDDPDEGTASPANLTFTPANWNGPQQVMITGQDDDLADGPQTFNIVSMISSADGMYDGLAADDIPVTNIDDETAGILVSQASGDTSEASGQATFTVVLTSQPLDDVVIALDSNDPSEGVVSATSLTFTDQDWSAPQTVTVTGLNDDLADGSQPYAIEFSSVTSNDTDYAALLPAPVSLSNIDDDSAGILVSAPSGPTAEMGMQATFTVVLSSEPLADVTLDFDTSDATEGTPDKTSLTFTSANWSVPQTVTMTGLDDALNDGYQVYAIQFSPASSGDLGYNGMALPNLELVNIDDETPGFILSEATGPTTEGGGMADFTVVLTKQPAQDVTVNFDTSNAAEGMPMVTSLVFTSADFDQPQSVTVVGQDDANVDGDQPYRIDFTATVSLDGFYDGLVPASVSFMNNDNDGGGGGGPKVVGYYDMTQGQGNTTQEAGIITAGHTPVALSNVTATDLAGIDVLVVQNPSNSAYGSEYLAGLSDIDAAVQAGMVLIIHDRYVTGATTVLPGGGSISCARDFTNDDDVNINTPGTLVTDGPGGMLDDASLDGGNSSSHGYCTEASIPSGLNILARPTATQSVTFSYPHGAGMVIYSTIPLDYYLAGSGAAALQANMADVYYPNVVAYGASL